MFQIDLLNFVLLSENMFAIQPFGPKMCFVLCQNHHFCSSHQFDEMQLECGLVLNTSSLQLNSKTSKKRIMRDGSAQLHDATIGCRKGVTIGAGKVPGCSASDVKLFHAACEEGDLVKVKRLVCQGMVDVNCPGEEEKTAVMIAAEKKQETLFDFLVQSNADLLSLDEDKYNVLHYACWSGSAYIVKKLLFDHNMKTDVVTFGEELPLMIALYEGHMPVVKLLLERGAHITPNEYQDSILHEACIGGHIDMVKYVLSLNITNLESRGTAGRTPLMFAACKGHVSIVILLRVKGADAKTIDDYGNNILINSCVEGHVEMITYILSLNIIDIRYKGQFGRTAFMNYVRHDGRKIAEMLREKESDITVLDMYNNSILHFACKGGHIDMVKYVLSLNVSNIETRGSSGRTPIMIAVCYGNMETVKLLHKHHNASLTKLDDEGQCVLHLACLCGDLDLLKYLLTFDELRSFENRRDNDGNTPLQVAKDENETEIATFLEERKNRN